METDKIFKIEWDEVLMEDSQGEVNTRYREIYVTPETYNEILKNFEMTKEELPIEETIFIRDLNWVVHN